MLVYLYSRGIPANIVTKSVFEALSICSGLVVAVLLCMKRNVIYSGIGPL